MLYYFGEINLHHLVKVSMNVFYDPVILLLDVHSMKTLAHIQSQDLLKNIDEQTI